MAFIITTYQLEPISYALKDRTRDLGFSEIRVIDTDLGLSTGVGAASRTGFDQLIASVALGEVGMILSREVSRLSRTDKDWARLLEVCPFSNFMRIASTRMKNRKADGNASTFA